MASAMVAASNVPAMEPRLVRAVRIVVVEQDPALRKILKRLFASQEYEVEFASDGPSALEMVRSRPFSAVILDLQSPGSAGWDLCREITRAAPGLPLLVLGATSDVVDKVVLLEMGADDYVTIPFSPRELLARTRALIRRASRIRPENFCVFGNVLVDFSKMEVSCSGEVIPLTAKEYKTLEFLIKNAQRVISRDELLNEVWGYQNYPCTRTVDNHILRLRQKLESDSSNPVHLLTMHGVGYKFVP
jgi:DNA-binding response OmpR family regulator